MDAWDDAFGASPDRDPDFGPDDRSGQPPLTMEERAGVLDDLAELEVFRTLLEPTGVKGIVVDCPDCDEEHHVDWALMQANLRQLLDEGQTGRHEPPFDPDPDDYVSWRRLACISAQSTWCSSAQSGHSTTMPLMPVGSSRVRNTSSSARSSRTSARSSMVSGG